MASGNYSGLLLCVLIILLALECSSAKCYEGNIGTKRDVSLQSDDKFLKGRKMLQVLDEKIPHISGENKPADIQNPGNKNVLAKHDNHISKENDESKTFLETADEVANLMRKDYRGAPRRKPPINNHQPKN